MVEEEEEVEVEDGVEERDETQSTRVVSQPNRPHPLPHLLIP